MAQAEVKDTDLECLSAENDASVDIRVAEMEDVIRLAVGEKIWSSGCGRPKSDEDGVALGLAADGTALLPRSDRLLLKNTVGSLSAGGKAVVARGVARCAREDEDGCAWLRVACCYDSGVKCGQSRCVRHCVDPRDEQCSSALDRRALTAAVCLELIEHGTVCTAPLSDTPGGVEERLAMATSIAQSRALTNEHRRAWLAATKCSHRKGLASKCDYVEAITSYAKQMSLFSKTSPPLWGPLRMALAAPGHDSEVPILVRLRPEISRAVRRAHRLYLAIVDGGRCASGWRAPTASVFRPEAAAESARRWTHGLTCSGHRYSVFSSRRDLLCWEAAVELRAIQDAAIEALVVEQGVATWEKRRLRRLKDEASTVKEANKLPVDLTKELQCEKQRSKLTAQISRDYRLLGPPPKDEVLASLRDAYDCPEYLEDDDTESNTAEGATKGDLADEDDAYYDNDESYSARSAAVTRLLSTTQPSSDAALHALWALACLRKCLTWRHLSEGSSWSDAETAASPAVDDWEGPFSELDFRLVLVEVVFRGACGCHVTGTLEGDAGDDKTKRWAIVDLLRFLVLCCRGPSGAEWRGRVRSRLSVCLGGRVAPRSGYHLHCPRARLKTVVAALSDSDLPPAFRVEFEKTFVTLSKKGGHASNSKRNALPTEVIHGGNPLARRVGENSELVSHNEDELHLSVSVEEYALEHYAQNGWWGLHCEGRPLAPLAILLLWDCIYLPLPGAFVHPWQLLPRDIRAPRDIFRRRRQAPLEDILHRVRSSPDLAGLVERAYVEHFGAPVLEPVPPLTLLQAIALGMGPEPLAGFLDAFAACFTTTGLPDLLLIRIDLPDGANLEPKAFFDWLGTDLTEPRCDRRAELCRTLPSAKRAAAFRTRFVEVKSYNDSLWVRLQLAFDLSDRRRTARLSGSPRSSMLVSTQRSLRFRSRPLPRRYIGPLLKASDTPRRRLLKLANC